MAWLPQTSSFPVGVPDGGGPADDALQLLDSTRPYKPLGVNASVDAYGRLVAVSQGHPEHGIVMLHAHPPFPQSWRHDQPGVRRWRRRLSARNAAAFGLRPSAAASVLEGEEVMDSARHAGKVAIVTGAASGIGRATVVRLAREGAQVVGCDLAEPALAETKTTLEQVGRTAELLMADITNQKDVERVVAAAGPRIDILANVAGIMDHNLPLGDLDDQTWDQVLAVNVTGVMRLSRAVLPSMLKAGGGRS